MHLEQTSDRTRVTPEDSVTQKELIARAGAKEVDGWRIYDVFKEIKKENLPREIKIINPRLIES